MIRTKVIMFVLILLAIVISNARTSPAVTQSISTAVATPEPTEGTPEPTGGTPEPTDGTPEPTEGTPEPTDGTPEPVETTAEADETTTEPVETSTEPVETTTEPVETTTDVPTYYQGTIITNAGEDDPTFNLTAYDMQTIQQMIQNLIPVSTPNWPQFGFRGYGLEDQGIPSLPPYLRVFQGVIQIFDDAGSNYYQDLRGLEGFLSQLASSGGSQSSATPTLVKRGAPGSAGGLPQSGSEPPYQPDNWNKAKVIEKNNCYAYATNTMGDKFPRPGRAGGKQPPSPGDAGYNCDNFVAGAVSDGLLNGDCDKVCPNGTYKVALVLNPNTDYHWYRQDDNGNWSHKPGATEATNVDNSKQAITDPRTADRGPYTTFCQCMCVPPKKITIRAVLFNPWADVAAAPDGSSVGF